MFRFECVFVSFLFGLFCVCLGLEGSEKSATAFQTIELSATARKQTIELSATAEIDRLHTQQASRKKFR